MSIASYRQRAGKSVGVDFDGIRSRETHYQRTDTFSDTLKVANMTACAGWKSGRKGASHIMWLKVRRLPCHIPPRDDASTPSSRSFPRCCGQLRPVGECDCCCRYCGTRVKDSSRPNFVPIKCVARSGPAVCRLCDTGGSIVPSHIRRNRTTTNCNMYPRVPLHTARWCASQTIVLVASLLCIAASPAHAMTNQCAYLGVDDGGHRSISMSVSGVRSGWKVGTCWGRVAGDNIERNTTNGSVWQRSGRHLDRGWCARRQGWQRRQVRWRRHTWWCWW